MCLNIEQVSLEIQGSLCYLTVCRIKPSLFVGTTTPGFKVEAKAEAVEAKAEAAEAKAEAVETKAEAVADIRVDIRIRRVEMAGNS